MNLRQEQYDKTKNLKRNSNKTTLLREKDTEMTFEKGKHADTIQLAELSVLLITSYIQVAMGKSCKCYE